MKITLAQQPARAAALGPNQALLTDQIYRAISDAADLLLTGARPLAGDAADLRTEPGFAADLGKAVDQVTSLAAPTGMHLTADRLPLSAITSRSGLTVALAEVTDPTVLTQVANAAAARGAQVLAIAAALPYQVGGPEARRAELVDIARSLGITIVFCNRVGGADTRVYDGGSLLISPAGTVVYQAPLFAPETITLTIDHEVPMAPQRVVGWPDPDEQTWTALTVGTRDYVHHNGFTDVVLGLSGGIDSAVVATLAVDALGADHVHGIGMPGPYSSDHSVTDAETLAANLGIRFDLASIKGTYEAEVAALGDLLTGPGSQVAKENIQARLRALHLFTIANARNALVLNTCQKSEDAVGYATYGGDALGGYAPMVDLLKRDVYRLANWRNMTAAVAHARPPIPAGTLTKAPSAELSPGQQDTDTLPPYDILDTIVDRYLTHRESADQIVAHLRHRDAATGRDVAADVAWVLTMIDRTEWKRRQAPPGPQVTAAPFAARNVPMTNGRVHRPTR